MYPPNVEKQQSNLEHNMGRIFGKKNSLTEQLKEKFHQRSSEILGNSKPKRAVAVFGCHFKRKELWVLAVLSLCLFTSFTGVAVMWWTAMFDNYVISQLTLANNTDTFLLWKNPPIKSFVKIHIFNYTNVEDYQAGLVDKLHVKDVGPFVYEESTEKINVKINSNFTISYQEIRTHTFRPDLSKSRKEADRVIVPNLAVLSAAAVSQESFYLTRLALSTILRSLNADPFLNLAAHRFIWGYDDRLLDLAKTIMFEKKLPFEKFGIMAMRNGTSDDVITVHSGVNDFSKIAQIDRINGENYLEHWGTPDCNHINGSDGGFYPIFDVRQKKPVSMYFKEICRHIPLVFRKKVNLLDGQVDAYRYAISDTVFDSPETEPNNQCYCESGACAPHGVYNMSKCAFGAPAAISFPHFYKADPDLQLGVSGLSPSAKKHSSHMDLHPRFGFPMSGTLRLQLNIQVKKSPGMSQLDMFKDDVYLPVVWVEAGVTPSDLPDTIKDFILKASVTLPAFENALKYGFLLLAILSFLSIVYILTRKFQERYTQIIDFPQISFVYT